MNQFYSYMWLRDDGSPYYVGKGHGSRAYVRFGHQVCPPADSSKILIFPQLNEADAFESEIELIKLFGRKDNGTGCLVNHTNGGENPPKQLGLKRSLETRKKMSEAQRGRPVSDETKQKIRLALKGKRTGRRMSEMEKAALRRANLGRPLSEEHRRKLSASHIGKSAGMLGLFHSDETKLKLSQANQGKVPWNKGQKLIGRPEFEVVREKMRTSAAIRRKREREITHV